MKSMAQLPIRTKPALKRMAKYKRIKGVRTQPRAVTMNNKMKYDKSTDTYYG